MDETSTAPPWPGSMLHVYGDMLSVSDVARALYFEERDVRSLLTNTDRNIRLPGVEIGESWRIARERLRSYLATHPIEDSLLSSPTSERGMS